MAHRPPRLRVESIVHQSKKGKEWIEAVLTYKGETIVGRSPAVKPGDAVAGVKRTAIATLDAIETFTGGRLRCGLVEVDLVRIGGQNMVVLVIDLDKDGSVTRVFGNCRARGELLAATARAILNATNPYIEVPDAARTS